MSSPENPNFPNLTRRNLLYGTAALSAAALLPSAAALAQAFPTAKVNTTGLAVTDTEVTVGILHSVTGTMAISETGSGQAGKIAHQQSQPPGGGLGPQNKINPEGRGSHRATLPEKGKKTLGKEQE